MNRGLHVPSMESPVRYMLSPFWIVILAFFYGVEYLHRFYRTRNYISAGKALARWLVMGVYIWIWVFDPAEFEKAVYVRWALFMLLAVDVFYIGQEHIMERLRRHGHRK